MKGYYTLRDGKDIIDMAFQAGEGAAFCRWLALKYIVRAGRKEGEALEKDLAKAIDVLMRWAEWEKGQHAREVGQDL